MKMIQSSTPARAQSSGRMDPSTSMPPSRPQRARWVSSSECRIRPTRFGWQRTFWTRKSTGSAGTGPGWADSKGFERSNVQGRPPFEGATDTVGVLARDKHGIIVCATSTGGTSNRPPGRVGDVPLPGCGFWVQDGVGVGATGIGEAITRGMISLRVADRILDGNDLEESMMWALDECLEGGAEVGIIALGAEGTGHGVSNSTNMPWASWIARK